ncbi:MAG: ATP-binding protein [Deltaproteobacteria bacterium]|nr:MAG: ATP-binding protein [Deltaproteobacteria bacterium]
MYIQRTSESRLAGLLEGRKVIIVLGARQVGKTTLVQRVLAGRKVVSLNFDVDIDKLRFQAAASLSPSDALQSLGNPDYLVVDEAQRLPETGRIVKGWYDAQLPVKLLLLGSSGLDLLNHATESLTGRNEKLFLPPLLFDEAIRSRDWCPETMPLSDIARRFSEPVHTCLLQSLAFGGYPEAVTTADKPALLRNLSSDYLWKDILQTGLVKSPDLIKRLLMLLAHQVGSEVSVHELATQLHMARQTVERYLDLLERTWVIFRLPSYSTNPRKEIAKSRKIYFWDTGIRNALLGAFSTDELRPDIGPLWENWVIAEVAKRNALFGGSSQLYFWRSRAQSEVDLVIRTGDRLRAFEIKWKGRRPVGRAFRAMYGVDVEMIDAGNPFAAGSALGV